MKTIILSLACLRPSERIALIAATIIGGGLSYVGMLNGHNVISNEVIGPMVMLVFVWQSTLITGIMRFRSKAMNHLLTTCLVELKAVRLNPGQHVPTKALDMVAEFLGDKK